MVMLEGLRPSKTPYKHRGCLRKTQGSEVNKKSVTAIAYRTLYLVLSPLE